MPTKLVRTKCVCFYNSHQWYWWRYKNYKDVEGEISIHVYFCYLHIHIWAGKLYSIWSTSIWQKIKEII